MFYFLLISYGRLPFLTRKLLTLVSLARIGSFFIILMMPSQYLHKDRE